MVTVNQARINLRKLAEELAEGVIEDTETNGCCNTCKDANLYPVLYKKEETIKWIEEKLRDNFKIVFELVNAEDRLADDIIHEGNKEV